ncbi:hypothetical protein B0H10DRAFT_2430957 [Mycena sp. CBHHK59/15]|nr:hypothetical protein B0H10DRAFT_2430957 [Mycena sp. CBHHK59/15]
MASAVFDCKGGTSERIYGGQQGYRRIALGAAPVLFAWPTLALNQTMALAAQWAGFTALWRADSNATAAGWMAPKWHSQYRFHLSTLVGTCILGSLAGITYWGPIGGHGLLARELDQVREERKALHARNPEAQYGTRRRCSRAMKEIEREMAEKQAPKKGKRNSNTFPHRCPCVLSMWSAQDILGSGAWSGFPEELYPCQFEHNKHLDS